MFRVWKKNSVYIYYVLDPPVIGFFGVAFTNKETPARYERGITVTGFPELAFGNAKRFPVCWNIGLAHA